MIRNMFLFAALASASLAFQAPRQVQNKKQEVREVKATGCVRRGVEGGCLLLKTLDGKTTYNILANPRPEPDIVITIEGKPFRGVTACMEGLAITVTKWAPTGEKCSN